MFSFSAIVAKFVISPRDSMLLLTEHALAGRLDGLVLAEFLAPFDLLVTPLAKSVVLDRENVERLLRVLVVLEGKAVLVLLATRPAPISASRRHDRLLLLHRP